MLFTLYVVPLAKIIPHKVSTILNTPMTFNSILYLTTLKLNPCSYYEAVQHWLNMNTPFMNPEKTAMAVGSPPANILMVSLVLLTTAKSI